MDFNLDRLPKDERVTLKLRALYEDCGYKRFKLTKFEEYAFYLDNKDFLQSERVITFTDMNGKLLALKPDITLSIAKTANINAAKTEKLYYLESVFRYEKHTNQFKETVQLGLEVMGDVNQAVASEVVTLAMSSLKAVDEDYILPLSHMGYVTGLLESLRKDDGSAPDESEIGMLKKALRNKSVHDARAIGREIGILQSDIDRFVGVLELRSDVTDGLNSARRLAEGYPKMVAAIEDLSAIASGVCPSERSKLRLDFSIVNDANYYNGITFLGFVAGSSAAVLTGGRYDLLLAKLKKPLGCKAMGFALATNAIV